MSLSIPKLNPAPLPNNGQGGYLNMSKDNSLAKKQNAEKEALLAQHKADLANLDHKHGQERTAAATKSQGSSRGPRRQKGK